MITLKGYFTCDNSFQVYIGDSGNVKSLVTQATSSHSSQIFQEKYLEIDALPSDYLYVIAWSFGRESQGFIADFTGEKNVLTGSGNWEVLSTGITATKDFPSNQIIQTIISGTKDTSWKQPHNGSANTIVAQPFGRKVDNISQQAHWIWYDDKSATPDRPFFPFSGFKRSAILVFRLPVEKLSSGVTTTNYQPDGRHMAFPYQCNQPVIVSCCQSDCNCKKPTPEAAPKPEKCCNGNCTFEVRFQRWRYVSGSPGFLDGQAEIKFTSHVNGNMFNYPSTNGSWVGLNKRKGDYPKGWRAANSRLCTIEVPCSGRKGIDIMTELMETNKKGGASFEGGEPYGTSEVDTVTLECGKKPNYVRHTIKLEHGGNRTEDLEIEVEYYFSEVSSCNCPDC